MSCIIYTFKIPRPEHCHPPIVQASQETEAGEWLQSSSSQAAGNIARPFLKNKTPAYNLVIIYACIHTL